MDDPKYMDYMICSAPEVSDGCFDPEDLPRLFRRVSVLEEGFAQMNEVVQCMGRKLAPTPSQPVEHDQSMMRTEDKMCPKNGQLVEQACQISDLQHEFQQTFEKLRQEFVASMDPQGLHRELESMVGRVATDIQEMYTSDLGCLRTEVEQLATEFRHEVARRSNGTDSIGISQDVSQTSQAAQGETEKLQQEITRSIKQMRENLCAEITTSITQMRDEQEAKMCAISAALGEELAGVEKKVKTALEDMNQVQQDLEDKLVARAMEEAKMAMDEKLDEHSKGTQVRDCSISDESCRGPFCPTQSLYSQSLLMTKSRSKTPDLQRAAVSPAVRHISQPVMGLNPNSSQFVNCGSISSPNSMTDIRAMLGQNRASTQATPQQPAERGRSLSSEPRDTATIPSINMRSVSPILPTRVRSVSPQVPGRMISLSLGNQGNLHPATNQMRSASMATPATAGSCMRPLFAMAPDRDQGPEVQSPREQANAPLSARSQQSNAQGILGSNAPLSARSQPFSKPAFEQKTVSLRPTPVLQCRSPDPSATYPAPSPASSYQSPAPSVTPAMSGVNRMQSSHESRNRASTPRGMRENSYATAVSKRSSTPVFSDQLSARIEHILAMKPKDPSERPWR